MVQVRPFEEADSEQASRLIVRCLREVNSRDYTGEQIQRICEAFTPQQVARRFGECTSFVAVKDEQVIGTATLKGNEVGSVFVTPDLHGLGIGKLLMNHVESVAAKSGLTTLTAYASLAAIGFYKHLGYRPIREKVEPDGEVTLEIEKHL